MHSDETQRTIELGNVRPQTFLNGEIHDWYRTIFGYSDHLVGKLLDEFSVDESQLVFDPFCGSGTTLVECMKRGIDSVGIDANPVSQFAARVKTNWGLTENRIMELLPEIRASYSSFLRRTQKYKKDPTYAYLDTSGMVERGWISEEPLRKALALKAAILSLSTNFEYINFFLLALLAELVGNISNIKFGPTLYCGPVKQDVDVIGKFEIRVKRIAQDLTIARKITQGAAKVLVGDSRECGSILGEDYVRKFSSVITSPPYPSEHDYTRNSRLELAFLENVTSRSTLQKIKKAMLRSNTKGIYKSDSDGDKVQDNQLIKSIIRKIEPRARKKSHGFARLYTTVVSQYFGGMYRHFESLKPYLAEDAKLAYIVGDQSSYLKVHVPTAQILGEIAESLGYEVVKIQLWRSRWASSSSTEIAENILILKNA